MTERAADQQTEKPKRSLRAGGGTVEGKGVARQADAAREENAGEEATKLMEEVCARANLIRA